MAARMFLTAVLAVLFCSHVLAFTDSEKEKMRTDVEAMLRNAKFQRNLGLVATSTQIYAAQTEEMKRARSPEEKDCIRKNTQEAVTEGEQIVLDTLGKIIPELTKVAEVVESDNVSDDEWQIVATFLNNTDYPKYKSSAMSALKSKLVIWVPEKQGNMSKCIA